MVVQLNPGSGRIAHAAITINAPRERVWRALVDPATIGRWMPALEAFFHYRNIDVSTGTRIRSTGWTTS